MDRQLQLILKLKDEASAQLDSVGRKGEVFGVSMGKLGGILAGVFATKKILDFGISSVEAFSEAEAQMTRFNTTLKTMGKAGEDMRQTLIDASNATLKLGFDNETTANQMAKFAQLTGNAKDAIELNNISMDLARAKNIDYETASHAVQLTLAGNSRALKEFGINIKDSATPLEALGQLQVLVAGQATAFTGTTAGSMEVLKTSFGELKEVVGETLAKSITPLIKDLTAFVTDPRTLDFLKLLATAIGVTLQASVWIVKTAFDGWYQIVTNTWAVLKLVVDWLKSVFIGAFNAVKSAVEAVASSIERVISIYNKAKSAIGSGLSAVGHAIGSAIGVNDAIISPNGQVITTHPDDYIIATKNPSSLAGAGNITINVSGNTLLDGNAGDVIGDQIMKVLKNQLRL